LFDQRSLAIISRIISPSAPWSSVWCAPNTQTYVVLTTSATVAASTIHNLLTGCQNIVENHIATVGDGLLSDGVFDYLSDATGVSFQAWNANNHQTTWGVLGAALAALVDCMGINGYGAASFTIYDGDNLVGLGRVGSTVSG
ncbi:hypothetical protein MMC08_008366, partial [Hypocenomyce scalaris]|nr:hypothetical protein [Hypocenomyce scalaris]